MWKVEPRVRVGGRWQVSMCGAHLRIFWNIIEVNLNGKYIKWEYIKWEYIKWEYIKWEYIKWEYIKCKYIKYKHNV